MIYKTCIVCNSEIRRLMDHITCVKQINTINIGRYSGNNEVTRKILVIKRSTVEVK